MTNRIHQLDTREQKSPQYLKKIPNLIHEKLEAGDYLTADKAHFVERTDIQNRVGLRPSQLGRPNWQTVEWDELQGHLVENKFDDFDIQSTDTLDQFRKELSQMCEWHKENPHVVLHAAWVKKGLWKNPYVIKDDGTPINVIKVFMSMCAEYDVWPHFYETGEDLLKFYRKLDQPKAYQKHRIFIKKDRTKITLRAKKLRQHPRVSSELAVTLDANLTREGIVSEGQMFWDIASDGFGPEMEIHPDVALIIIKTIGRKKNNKPKKLAVDLIDYMENGPKQKKQDPPVVFDGVF